MPCRAEQASRGSHSVRAEFVCSLFSIISTHAVMNAYYCANRRDAALDRYTHFQPSSSRISILTTAKQILCSQSSFPSPSFSSWPLLHIQRSRNHSTFRPRMIFSHMAFRSSKQSRNYAPSMTISPSQGLSPGPLWGLWLWPPSRGQAHCCLKE